MTDDMNVPRRPGPETNDIASLDPELLRDQTVYDRHEGTVGTIRDVVVSEDGHLEVAVIDVGGFLGIAAHNVGINAEKLNIRHGQGDAVRVYLDMTDEELRALPQWGGLIPPAVGGFRSH
jgi:hypothetical protein